MKTSVDAARRVRLRAHHRRDAASKYIAENTPHGKLRGVLIFILKLILFIL